jgi:AraC-like DNA-binding protein
LVLEKIPFTAEKSRDEVALVRKMLLYMQQHFTENLSRAVLARALGYAEAHLSRVFHRYVQTGISEYINGLRLGYIDGKIADGYDGTMTELIYEAGFNSQQTYYRVRKKAKK